MINRTDFDDRPELQGMRTGNLQIHNLLKQQKQQDNTCHYDTENFAKRVNMTHSSLRPRSILWYCIVYFPCTVIANA